MQTVFQKALELIMSGDRELCNILLVTAKMSLTSSLISLLIGVPVGLWLGTCKFPGNSILVIINRTLMGMPPSRRMTMTIGKRNSSFLPRRR